MNLISPAVYIVLVCVYIQWRLTPAAIDEVERALVEHCVVSFRQLDLPFLRDATAMLERVNGRYLTIKRDVALIYLAPSPEENHREEKAYV